MRRVFFTALSVSLVLGASPLSAQQRWSVELRGGAAWATGDPGGEEVGTGFGLEGTVAYRFMPHLAAYAGWDWMHFPVDDSGAAAFADIEETGYAFGLQFEHPLGAETVPLLRIRAGKTYDHIELEDDDGEVTADSGHGLGWEAGAGILFPIAGSWRLTPGVRYRALNRDVEIESVTVPMEMRYIVIEIGVSRLF